MKTDLAGAYSAVYRKLPARWDAFETPDDYNAFLRKLSGSSATKTWARAREQKDLWLFPKIALLCSDTALISASILSSKGRLQIMARNTPEDFTLPISFSEKLKDKIVQNGFAYPDQEIVERWFSDAEPLVENGQLICLPERIILTAEKGADGAPRNWAVEEVDNREEWNILKPYLPHQQNSNSLISVSDSDFSATDIADLMGIDVPLISAMRLGEFAAFLATDGDCVITFRAALRKALNEAAALAKRQYDPIPIRTAIVQIKADLVEPALALLNVRYENLIRTKRIGATGATVSSLALSLAMLATPTIAAGVALLGGTGLGGLMQVLESFKTQNAALRENPWYLLWRLRKAISEG